MQLGVLVVVVVVVVSCVSLAVVNVLVCCDKHTHIGFVYLAHIIYIHQAKSGICHVLLCFHPSHFFFNSKNL